MSKLYQQMSSLIGAIHNCRKPGNAEWEGRHTDRLEFLAKNHLPSGGGIDSGSSFNFEKSTPEKLVINTSFHHMNEHGYYDGWTDHTVTVTASLAHGINIKISGRNRNGIKDYLHDTFSHALQTEIDPASTKEVA